MKATGKPAKGAGGGITAPVTRAPELAEIVGSKDLPRSELVSKMWDYMKKNDLQGCTSWRGQKSETRI